MQLLEEQGVERCVLYPSTMALSVEQYVLDTPIAYANIHSFNRWFDETWDFDGDHISPTALLSFRDLDRSVAELEHVLDRGARVVLFPTGPARGRSPGDPYFDPIWARLRKRAWWSRSTSWSTGTTSTSRPRGDSIRYPRPGTCRPGSGRTPTASGRSRTRSRRSSSTTCSVGSRACMVLASEFGASWVPHFVVHMDKSRGMGRNGPWIGGPLRERPSEIFRRHVRVAPYPEDDVVKIVDRPRARRLDRDGLRLPARRGTGSTRPTSPTS